jgi:hypothetical protein
MATPSTTRGSLAIEGVANEGAPTLKSVKVKKLPIIFY